MTSALSRAVSARRPDGVGIEFPPSEAATARLGGLDGLKGLAILLVVAIHAAPLGDSAYREHFVGGLARLAVPLFLIVTGYLNGLHGSDPGKLAGYFRTFLRMHLVYGAIYFAIFLATGGLAEVSARSIWRAFGAGAYAGQFYLVVLLQVFLLAGYVLPPHFWRATPALLASAALAWAGIFALAAAFQAEEPGVLLAMVGRLRGNPVWLWFFYFHLGAWLGSRSGKLRTGSPMSSLGAAAAVTLSVALATSDVPSFTSDAFDATFPYARASIFLAATALAGAVPWLAGRATPSVLQGLGRESFAIYVLNPALLLGLYAIAGRPAGALTSWVYVAATVALASLAGSLLRRHAPLLLP